MQVHGVIHQFPREIKFLIIVFVATLSIGYFGGLSFVNDTTNASSKGIQERYLGNEDDEEATKMMFKKSEGEIKTLVHNHILSISVIFFLLAIILSTTSIGMKLKLFLMILLNWQRRGELMQVFMPKGSSLIFLATAANDAPVDMPLKMPSSFANLLAYS